MAPVVISGGELDRIRRQVRTRGRSDPPRISPVVVPRRRDSPRHRRAVSRHSCAFPSLGVCACGGEKWPPKSGRQVLTSSAPAPAASQVQTVKVDTAKEAERNHLKTLSDERAAQWPNTISVSASDPFVVSTPPTPLSPFWQRGNPRGPNACARCDGTSTGGDVVRGDVMSDAVVFSDGARRRAATWVRTLRPSHSDAGRTAWPRGAGSNGATEACGSSGWARVVFLVAARAPRCPHAVPTTDACCNRRHPFARRDRAGSARAQGVVQSRAPGGGGGGEEGG